MLEQKDSIDDILKRMQTDEQVRIKSIDRFVNHYNVHNIGDGRMLYVGYDKSHKEYFTTTFVNNFGNDNKGFKYFAQMAEVEINSSSLVPIVTFAIFGLVDHEVPQHKRPLAQFLCVESTFYKVRVWIATKHGHGQAFDIKKARINNNADIESIVKLFEILNFKTCDN